jgi:type II secretory pathway component GspD/PulD (secretin)
MIGGKQMFSKKLTLVLCLTLALAFFTLPAFTQEEEEKAEEVKKEITVDYPEGAEITDFLRFIREKLGKKVSVLPGRDVSGRIKPIYLTATPEVILDRVLTVNGFGYDWDKTNNIITIFKAKAERERKMEEMTSETFSPKYINAKSLEPRLNALKSPEGKILVEELMNFIFVTDHPSNIKSMKALVKVLDKRTSGVITTKTFIVKYQTPKEIAKGLKKLKSKRGKIIPNNKALTITVTDYPNVIDSMQKYIESMDVKRLQTKQFTLNYARAKDLEDTLESFLSESGVLEIDERTNTVLIKDMPEFIKDLEKQIELLDTESKQVLVEVTFVELTSRMSLEVGANWSVFEETTNSSVSWGSNPFKSPMSGETSSLILHSDIVSNFSAFLRLKYEDVKFNILSNPRVVVTDGTEAKIRVVTKWPSIAISAATRTPTVGFEEAPIELTVTPQIKPNNVISLNLIPHVSQKVEDYADSAPASIWGDVAWSYRVPVIESRDLEIEQIDVLDGATVMLGGLIKEVVAPTLRKIPILGDIPLLGSFFRSKVVSRQSINLAIFVTPHLLPSAHLLDNAEMYKRRVGEMGLLESVLRRMKRKEEEGLTEFERVEREILGEL